MLNAASSMSPGCSAYEYLPSTEKSQDAICVRVSVKFAPSAP